MLVIGDPSEGGILRNGKTVDLQGADKNGLPLRKAVILIVDLTLAGALNANQKLCVFMKMLCGKFIAMNGGGQIGLKRIVYLMRKRLFHENHLKVNFLLYIIQEISCFVKGYVLQYDWTRIF
jgi:hypothetical protein